MCLKLDATGRRDFLGYLSWKALSPESMLPGQERMGQNSVGLHRVLHFH